MKSYAYKRPIVNTLGNLSHPINTGIYRVHTKFKDILQKVGKTSPLGTGTQIIVVDDVFFKGIVTKKADADSLIIGQLYNEKINQLKNKGLEIFFTDGSVFSDFSGSAFIHEGPGIVFSYFGDLALSSMSAELIAIVKALEYAANNQIRKLAILCDCLSGLVAIKNNQRGNYLVDRINWLASEHFEEIELHHIPGHCSIPLNETVDQAARMAREIGSQIETPLTISDAINHITHDLWIEWANEYKERGLSGSSHYFTIFPEVTKRPWFHNTTSTPFDTKTLNRVVTNHAFCNATLERMKAVPSALCETCCTEENVNHILFQCHRFSSERNSNHYMRSSRSTVDFINKHGIKNLPAIAEFLHKIKFNL